MRLIRLFALDMGVTSRLTRLLFAFCVFSSLAFCQSLLLLGFLPNSGLFPPAIRFVRHAAGPLGNFLYITRDSLVLANGVRIQIAGIDPGVQPAGDSPMTTIYNSYEGRDTSQWMTNTHQFSGVKLSNVYPGVSATLTTTLLQTITSSEGQGEVIFSIAPGDLDGCK